jgi:hypothetical protein
MQPYRCPIDDCVFTPTKQDRVPTLEGHPECPGPVCQEKFAGYFNGGDVRREVTHTESKPVAVAKPATVLQPPSPGQGW